MDSPQSMTLDDLRGEIDTIDEDLVGLLSRRATMAQEVGRMKANGRIEANGLRSPERELAIMERLRKLNHGPLPDSSIELIYREIFRACLEVQR